MFSCLFSRMQYWSEVHLWWGGISRGNQKQKGLVYFAFYISVWFSFVILVYGLLCCVSIVIWANYSIIVYFPWDQVVVVLTGGVRGSTGGTGNGEKLEVRELRAAPSGPDPLHHNGGSPKKPRTPWLHQAKTIANLALVTCYV